MNTSPTFKIGSPATECGYSDRHAGWITSVSKSGTRVTFARGKATLLNGPASDAADALQVSLGGFAGHVSGTQRWHIERDTEAPAEVYSLRRNGRWVRRGESAAGGARLVAGHSHHYDFNF
jgi:hypothetical protein